MSTKVVRYGRWKTNTITGASKLTEMTATFVVELFTAAGYKPD